MTWALAGQITVCWLVIGFIASPYVGRWLRKRRQRSRSAECARLEKLVDLADEFDAASTDAERQRIYIKATALGFTDDAHPFMLDDIEQPHPPRAA